MKRRLLILTLLAALLSAVASPLAGRVSAAPAAQSHPVAVAPHSHAAAFDKTRFVAHLAVAAFLIHYIYNKYKQGKLGRTHIFTDIKAAAAALIAYHELKVAYGIANGSKSKTLQAIVAPMNALATSVSNMRSRLLHGDTSGVASVNGQQNSFQSMAKSNGYAYTDQQPSGFKGF
ncbi:MAG: hypothetical protein JOZ41_13555 [Chloroflexi bacterium]|nr:hypothetical protein [Chloroflexota bacterium]